MLQRREFVSPAALDIMRSILVLECAIRRISPDGPESEKLASAIMNAYLDGVTDPAELKAVARNSGIVIAGQTTPYPPLATRRSN